MGWKDKAKAALSYVPAARRIAVDLKIQAEKKAYEQSFAMKYAVNDRLVYFCAYSGKQFACSPKELYLAMQKDKAYKDFCFVWAFTEPEKFAFLMEDGRTTLVKYGSDEHKEALACAKYWISNTRVLAGTVKKPEQVYIQTWHGTPLKKLGWDVEHYIKGADDLRSLRQNYEMDAKRFDVLLSPSPFYTEKISSAFHLKAIGKADVILEKGYPRNDPLYRATKGEALRIREELGIPDGKKVILYAPTWREDNLNPAKGFTYSSGLDFTLGLNFKKFQQALGPDYVVLLRTHYFVSRAIRFEDYGDALIDVSDYPDVNELYIASDLLLTDYSSVFFDYSILRKPMVFYMYDLERYKKVRDFYFDLSLLPGPIVEKEEELATVIQQEMQKFAVDSRYEAFLEKFNPIEGPCADKVLHCVIEKD